MTIRAVAGALALAACTPPAVTQAQTGGAGQSVFAAAPQQQWRLPGQLREISGLAATRDGRVFAHDDEQAIIYEIDAGAGRLVKAFALGDPVERGDFEGLAITPDGDFHVVTATGELLSFREGPDGAHVPFERRQTGLGGVCEVEGLAYFAPENSLILACKRNQARDMRDTISLHALRLDTNQLESWLSLPESDIVDAAGVEHFRPSGVEIDPSDGRILLISANDAAFVELSRRGEILAARALIAGHPQTEGVTIARDGALLLADEGGDGRALLSRYQRNP